MLMLKSIHFNDECMLNLPNPHPWGNKVYQTHVVWTAGMTSGMKSHYYILMMNEDDSNRWTELMKLFFWYHWMWLQYINSIHHSMESTLGWLRIAPLALHWHHSCDHKIRVNLLQSLEPAWTQVNKFVRSKQLRLLPMTMITGSSLLCSTVVTNGQTKSIQSHLAMTFHRHRLEPE
jgi:hypothetical protein